MSVPRNHWVVGHSSNPLGLQSPQTFPRRNVPSSRGVIVWRGGEVGPIGICTEESCAMLLRAALLVPIVLGSLQGSSGNPGSILWSRRLFSDFSDDSPFTSDGSAVNNFLLDFLYKFTYFHIQVRLNFQSYRMSYLSERSELRLLTKNIFHFNFCKSASLKKYRNV